MKSAKLAVPFFACFVVVQVYLCAATADESKAFLAQDGSFSISGAKETYVGGRVGSFKPDLRQLYAPLDQLNAVPPGAAAMLDVFVRFRGMSRLSYTLEAGYWDNDTSLHRPESAHLGITFSHLTLSFLYYPPVLGEAKAIYLGAGVGIAHMKLYGSAVQLLHDTITKSEDTGISGSFAVGIEHKIKQRIVISVEANHIFKDFSISEEEGRKLRFDGTNVSFGGCARF